MPFISPPLLIMDLRGVVWAGAHSALTPFPFGVTLKPFRVTLKGLGPMPIGHSPYPLGVNPRVRGESEG